MTKEEKYRQQMIALGIYEEIFEPEIKTLGRLERELTRAQKEWSATADPKGSAPSFTEEIYPIIQKLRGEILQHRDALGLTPKALRKLRGASAEGPDQRDLICEKLDRIADRVGGQDEKIDVQALLDIQDSFGGVPIWDEVLDANEALDAERAR